jgi:uncharacterized Zn finger protein
LHSISRRRWGKANLDFEYFDYRWKPYVSAAQRRLKALREIEKRRKKGQSVSPVTIEGRTIAKTFWGKSWCENLERYSDYANRLPRGRTYVRNGSVVDLNIKPGFIEALVSGSELYEVRLKIAPVGRQRWKSICQDCSGAIDSLIELLQGRLSKAVMERICQERIGLFPAPAEIKLDCSCPDWAGMCKHVAAVLYGVGARFDHQPELLFRLRDVDEKELIAKAGTALPAAKQAPPAAKVLAVGDLADVFGLDMASSTELEVHPKLVVTKRKRGKAAKAKRSPRKPRKK